MVALIGDAGREASERGRALVDLAFQRAIAAVLLLVVSVLLAALVYRLASRRMSRIRPSGPREPDRDELFKQALVEDRAR